MTKKIFAFAVAFLALYFIMPANSSAQPFGYEGTQVCGTCHKTEKQGQQLKIWQESKHANAYKTLQTKEADEVAMKLYNKKAVEAAECLKCHVSGHDVDKTLLGAKFKMEDGVQCETCHGAGSGYKSVHIKNKEEAVKKGLILYKDETEIKAFCEKCHNSESPTFKEFKFEEMWPKIAHPLPKK